MFVKKYAIKDIIKTPKITPAAISKALANAVALAVTGVPLLKIVVDLPPCIIELILLFFKREICVGCFFKGMFCGHLLHAVRIYLRALSLLGIQHTVFGGQVR